MEAAAAFALAGNVLQFVQLGLAIVSKGNNLKRSHDGTLKDHAELDTVLNSLDVRLSSLEAGNDQTLSDLINKGKSIGTELRDALLKAKLKGNGGLWTNYRKALSIVWNKNTLEEVERRFERLRDEVAFHVLTVVRKDVGDLLHHSSDTLGSIDELKQRVQATHDAILARSTVPTYANGELLDEIRELRNMSTQLIDLAHAKITATSTVQSTSKRPNPEEFLQSLEFRTMDDREESISKAHARTYQWLLMDPDRSNSHSVPSWSYNEERSQLKAALLESLRGMGVKADTEDDPVGLRKDDQCPSKHLQQWLETGEGVFWIWGKPGCGKSTIMKAMLHTAKMKKRLTQLLSIWAGKKKLLTANFFFFRPGMSLQKSHTGFLRSLLLQILKQRPNLMNVLFTEREQRDAIARSRHYDDQDNVWSVEELTRAFRTWRRCDDSKLYLHVDGIDEVDSSYLEITNILLSMIEQKDVKILAAGRWAPEFYDTFSETLGLHETTELDILQYTVDNLNKPQVTNILDDPTAQFLSIVKDITTAAQGVFQWVKIVVGSLLHGARRIENFKQLQDRLHEYPEDLDRLYWFLYESIDQRHLADAANWLLIINAATKASTKHSERIKKGTNTHYFENYNNVFVSSLWKITTKKMHRIQSFSLDDPHWIHGACETDRNSKRTPKINRAQAINMQNRMRAQCPHFFDFGPPKGGTKIVFAHRTVLDFLSREDMIARFKAHVPCHKDPLLAIIAEGVSRFIGTPLQTLATLIADLEFELARKFWKQIQTFFENEHVRLQLKYQKMPTNYRILPTFSGWYFSDEQHKFDEIHRRKEPVADFLALYQLETAYVFKYASHAGMTTEEKELLMIERCWTGHGYWSLRTLQIDQPLFSQIFPSGVKYQSIGLRRVLESLQAVQEDESRFCFFGKDKIWPMQLMDTLQLMQLFIANGADPNLVCAGNAPGQATCASAMSIVQSLKDRNKLDRLFPETSARVGDQKVWPSCPQDGALADYQMQLMLLEQQQQNARLRLVSRNELEGTLDSTFEFLKTQGASLIPRCGHTQPPNIQITTWTSDGLKASTLQELHKSYHPRTLGDKNEKAAFGSESVAPGADSTTALTSSHSSKSTGDRETSTLKASRSTQAGNLGDFSDDGPG